MQDPFGRFRVRRMNGALNQEKAFVMGPAPVNEVTHDGNQGTIVEVERGTEEEDVVWLFGGSFQDAANITDSNNGPFLKAEAIQIFLKVDDGLAIAFDEQGMSGTEAERVNSDQSGSGKSVKEAGTRDEGSVSIKDSLAEPRGQGAIGGTDAGLDVTATQTTGMNSDSGHGSSRKDYRHYLFT